VEGGALGDRSQHLLYKIGAAMESVDFCNNCESLGGEMSLFFGEVVVKVDWKNQKITLKNSD